MISAPASSSTTSGSSTTYLVTAADTLSEIAARFSVPWTRIAAANGLAAPNYFVRTGQVLTIPAADGALTYVVTSSDTLSGIAARFDVDWMRIAEANGIAGPGYFVRTGQTLTIPAR